MVNYQNTKIYKIESYSGDKIYIGSTTKEYLSQRMQVHREDYRRWKKGLKDFVSSYEVFDEYGLENCFITLIETYPCSNKDEARSKEAHYIKSMKCVNRNIPNRTKQEYYQDNIEKIKEQHQQYRDTHKDQDKEYRKLHSQEIKEYQQEYRTDNKERIAEQQKKYYEANKVNYEAKKDKINERRRELRKLKKEQSQLSL